MTATGESFLDCQELQLVLVVSCYNRCLFHSGCACPQFIFLQTAVRQDKTRPRRVAASPAEALRRVRFQTHPSKSSFVIAPKGNTP